jgi:hypothetical protein
MANVPSEPLIKLEPGGKAPILSYNIPEPTAYSGRNFIELDFLKPNEADKDFFKPIAFEKPKDTRTSVKDLDPNTIKTAVVGGMKSGFRDAKLFPNVRLNSGAVRLVEKPSSGMTLASAMPLSPKLSGIDPEDVAAAMQSGKRLNIYTSMTGALTYNFVPEPKEPKPHLYLIETYSLSSFLGNYGAGRIVKTFTLLPGEKTKISVKTFTKTESTSKSASSILDSFTQESADDFESSVQQEQSDRESFSETFEYHAEAEASASWGFGSAKVSGGVKGGTNAAREEFSKNASNSVRKHAAKASAKRDVQINTSYEVKEESGEETSIERQIENINVSRTLNFIFRQMNQEFITLLHLVDVRIAFFNGFAESRREVALPDLDSLLDQYVVDNRHVEVKKSILDALGSILDYRGTLHKDFLIERTIDAEKYLRVNTDKTSVHKDALSGLEIPVQGIILSAIKNVMRTEGVIVEALLGQGVALDDYATRLQELEINRREAEVSKEKAKALREMTVNQLVKDNDKERSALLASLACPCSPTAPELHVTLDQRIPGTSGDAGTP